MNKPASDLLMPMGFATLVGGTCTAIGTSTNLLVINAGNYRFADFLRVGVPLIVISWLSLSWLLPARYGR